MKKAVFNMEPFTCPSCIKKIENTVGKIDGVQSVKVMFNSGRVRVDFDSAKTNADATRTVQETLQAQRQALSGVSTDEEAVNMMRQQRAFQGAAKLIGTVNELMQTLLQM